MANNWICPKILMKRKIHSYHICMKISSYVLKFSICHTFKVDDEERIPACMRSSPGGSWPSLSCWLCVSDINTTRMLPMEMFWNQSRVSLKKFHVDRACPVSTQLVCCRWKMSIYQSRVSLKKRIIVISSILRRKTWSTLPPHFLCCETFSTSATQLIALFILRWVKFQILLTPLQ